MTENSNLKEEPFRNKALRIAGIVALAVAAVYALFGLLDIIFMLDDFIMNKRPTPFPYSYFWLFHLLGLLLLLIMCLLIGFGGLLRRNILCALGMLGFGLILPVFGVFNYIIADSVCADIGRGNTFFNTFRHIIGMYLRPAMFVRQMNFPQLIILGLTFSALSIIFFLRAFKVKGQAAKVLFIVFAAVCTFILIISGSVYMSSMVAYQAGFMSLRRTGLITNYFGRISRILKEVSVAGFLVPSRFMALESIFSSIRIIAAFVMYCVSAFVGAFTIPTGFKPADKTDKA